MADWHTSRGWGRSALLALLAVFLVAPVWADDDDKDDLIWPPTGARVSGEQADGDDFIPDLVDDIPRFRFELTWRAPFVVGVKFKRGTELNAHEAEWRKDANVPTTPGYGWRIHGEVRFTQHWVAGGYFTSAHFRGGRRRIHHKGMGINHVQIPGRTRGRSSLDVFGSEIYLRYAMRDNRRLKFAFGIGISLASFRYRFDGPGLRANARIDTYWGPTISYMVQFALWERLHIFLESSFGVINPERFPSYVSEWRAGFRVPLFAGAELILALSQHAAQVEDTKDLWGGSVPSGHRWKQATWTLIGTEIGFAWRF